jgi:uncharacterized membrane protein
MTLYAGFITFLLFVLVVLVFAFTVDRAIKRFNWYMQRRRVRKALDCLYDRYTCSWNR